MHRQAVDIASCAVVRSLLILGGKWKMLMLYLLAYESRDGRLRYSDFQDSDPHHLCPGADTAAAGAGGGRPDCPESL